MFVQELVLPNVYSNISKLLEDSKPIETSRHFCHKDTANVYELFLVESMIQTPNESNTQ